MSKSQGKTSKTSKTAVASVPDATALVSSFSPLLAAVLEYETSGARSVYGPVAERVLGLARTHQTVKGSLRLFRNVLDLWLPGAMPKATDEERREVQKRITSAVRNQTLRLAAKDKALADVYDKEYGDKPSAPGNDTKAVRARQEAKKAEAEAEDTRKNVLASDVATVVAHAVQAVSSVFLKVQDTNTPAADIAAVLDDIRRMHKKAAETVRKAEARAKARAEYEAGKKAEAEAEAIPA